MYEVMIVDDDPTSLAIGKALLEPDYKIMLMKSGVQALGYLKNNPPPSVILLDMVMPGTSGMDVLKALKSERTLQDIPVIFLTTVVDGTVSIETFLQGAVDFIQKPVNPTLLKKKVAYQIERFRLTAENLELRVRVKELEMLLSRCHKILEKGLHE